MCILIGLGELPWGVIVKLIPAKFFVIKLSLEDKEFSEEEKKVYISTALKSKGKKRD